MTKIFCMRFQLPPMINFSKLNDKRINLIVSQQPPLFVSVANKTILSFQLARLDVLVKRVACDIKNCISSLCPRGGYR